MTSLTDVPVPVRSAPPCAVAAPHPKARLSAAGADNLALGNLDHRHAGHIRKLPPAGAGHTKVVNAVKRILNNMVGAGLVETSVGMYGRTLRGDRALAEYDASLGAEGLGLLRRVERGDRGTRGEWGLHPLAAAGLVDVNLRTGEFGITQAGRVLLRSGSA